MFKKILFVIVIFIVLAGSFLVKSFIQFSKQDKEQSSFDSYLNTYLNTSYIKSEGEHPYIRGKVVVINTDQRKVDYLTHPKLSDEIRAQKPEEAGTIVLVIWKEQREGVYKDVDTGKVTGDAYRSSAHLKVIDWTKKEILSEKDFFGEAPAGGLNRKGDYTSQWPMFEVVEYLENLPRKD